MACRIEAAHAPAPCGLRVEKRLVGGTVEVEGRRDVFRVEGNPDGCGKPRRRAGDIDRRGQGSHEALGERDETVRVRCAGDDEREFITGEPHHRIGRPREGDEHAGDVLEHLIAGTLPERLVDFLEAVHVHQEKGGVEAVAVGHRGCFLHRALEHRAVRDPGQGILLGNCAQLLKPRALLRDVLHHREHTAPAGRFVSCLPPHAHSPALPVGQLHMAVNVERLEGLWRSIER